MWGAKVLCLIPDVALDTVMQNPRVELSTEEQVWAWQNLEFQEDLAVLTLGRGHIFFAVVITIANNHNNARSFLDFFWLDWI